MSQQDTGTEGQQVAVDIGVKGSCGEKNGAVRSDGRGGPKKGSQGNLPRGALKANHAWGSKGFTGSGGGKGRGRGGVTAGRAASRGEKGGGLEGMGIGTRAGGEPEVRGGRARTRKISRWDTKNSFTRECCSSDR